MAERAIKNVLIIGAAGMLGSTLFRFFSREKSFKTFGTIRDSAAYKHFTPEQSQRLIAKVDVEGEAGLINAFSTANPDIVINCVGIIKQLPNASDHLESLAINAMLPHRLVKYCNMLGARLIHFSTDCVFSGKTGQYKEDDFPDAYDLYGRTKFLGEVDYENAITLRTSIIGHELTSNKSLLDWFLSQTEEVKGFRRAVFSGLPTIEVARVVMNRVLPNPQLRGLYHLSADPINKYDLLSLIAKTYDKAIKITPDDALVIDRSLNSDRFRSATGFTPKPWDKLVEEMHQEYLLAKAQNPG